MIAGFNLVVEPGRDDRVGGGDRGRQIDARKSALPILRADRRAHSDRRRRLSRAELRLVAVEPGDRAAAAASLQSARLRTIFATDKLDATQEEVEAAARLAGADAFIAALPNGYETQVGEGGNQLSLGQKQLISIARAMLKRPRLVVMDEATSSVDTETEQLIQQALFGVARWADELRDRASAVDNSGGGSDFGG